MFYSVLSLLWFSFMNSMMNSEHRQIQIGLTNRYMGNGWLCLFGLCYDEEDCVRRGALFGGRAMVVECSSLVLLSFLWRSSGPGKSKRYAWNLPWCVVVKGS